MDQSFWAKAHGATTHFPVALAICSAVFDASGMACGRRAVARDLHAAGYWTLLVGALGAVGAVVSGLGLTHGSVLGRGLLRTHHLFVWPAFGVLVAFATWRMFVGQRATRPAFAIYLGGMTIAAASVTFAAYWGGELLLSG